MTWTPKDGPSMEELSKSIGYWQRSLGAAPFLLQATVRAARAAHDLHAEVERLRAELAEEKQRAFVDGAWWHWVKVNGPTAFPSSGLVLEWSEAARAKFPGPVPNKLETLNDKA